MGKKREKQWKVPVTPAERRLALILDRHGYSYKQAHPIKVKRCVYYADFYFPDAFMVIEVDGRHHGEEWKKRRDDHRSRCIRGHGLVVRRLWNREVYCPGKRLKDLLDEIDQRILSVRDRQLVDFTFVTEID